MHQTVPFILDSFGTYLRPMISPHSVLSRLLTDRTILQSAKCFPSRSLQYKVQTKRLDPPYLLAKPPFPFYAELQFDLRGFDFVVLEHYVKYLRKFFGKLNLEFSGFALPAQRTTYKLYHQNSTNVRAEFELSKYRRICRVAKLKAIYLPIVMDVLYQNLPEGLELSVEKTDTKVDEERYVPQLEVQALQEELSKLNK
ncbi:39S ribosomal protein L48 mitochondrial [Fasciola gigantica]|uniref:39S ribosomal protein L48 mitochondrial n=1 Tax=Fasciola gigantica TaxID=46835 RepID=A0A504YYY7_FASGI|nr:39S ribosomal protein L48 mitochondrial [Fasciola gigantica]